MSADNTLLILATLRRDGLPGFEYRVAHVQAAGNITGPMEPDYPSAQHPVLHHETVLRAYAQAPLFFDETSARKYANRMEQRIIADCGIVEYGVKLHQTNVYFPATDAKKARRQRFAGKRH